MINHTNPSFSWDYTSIWQ